MENFVFLALVPYGKFHLTSDDIYLDNSLVQDFITFRGFNILMFCLSSLRWFMLCSVYMSCLGGGTGVRK
jgi:hypothetical protein